MSPRGGRTAFVKNIEFSLNPSDIEKAIREIRDFKGTLKRAMQGLCEDLLEDGALHAKVEVARLGAVDTGALMASIGYGAFDPATRTGIVYAGSYYACFVEFGTGIVGESQPHPGLSDGSVGDFAVIGESGVYTQYDTNGHGESGWWYRKVGSDRYRWTKGMPARPFMYNTYLHLSDFAEKYGGEIIAEFIV